jgi:hypothetical protein
VTLAKAVLTPGTLERRLSQPERAAGLLDRTGQSGQHSARGEGVCLEFQDDYAFISLKLVRLLKTRVERPPSR